MFINSLEAAKIVKGFFQIVSIGYIMYMITSCFLGELSGLGKPGLSMLLFFVYYIVIRIPLACILVNSTMGVKGIWTAILVSHVLAAILATLQATYSEYRMKGATNQFMKKIQKKSIGE